MIDNKQYQINGFNIIQVSDAYLEGFDGMNYEAAQFYEFPHRLGKQDILINEESGFNLKVHTIIHEITECKWMREGLKYWTAHTFAEVAENDPVNLEQTSSFIYRNIELYEYLLTGTGDSQL